MKWAALVNNYLQNCEIPVTNYPVDGQYVNPLTRATSVRIFQQFQEAWHPIPYRR